MKAAMTNGSQPSERTPVAKPDSQTNGDRGRSMLRGWKVRSQSKEVWEGVIESSRLARLFSIDVWRHRHEQASRYVTSDMPPALLEMQKHREAFHASVRALADRINDELRE